MYESINQLSNMEASRLDDQAYMNYSLNCLKLFKTGRKEFICTNSPISNKISLRNILILLLLLFELILLLNYIYSCVINCHELIQEQVVINLIINIYGIRQLDLEKKEVGRQVNTQIIEPLH